MDFEIAKTLRDKRVLITAGPTWAAIDSVRVISNIATGQTGILLADKLSAKGAKVTLLLGPGDCAYRNNRVRIVRFRFFEELRQALRKELGSKRYGWVIHSAAVSDFAPVKPFKGKISSDRPCILRLRRLPKLAVDIKSLAPAAKLVLFKLEPGLADKELLLRARKSLTQNRAALIVANKLTPDYKAYILDKDKVYCRSDSKVDMVRNLLRLMETKIGL